MSNEQEKYSFEIGDIVYLKSDINKKNPLTVDDVEINDEFKRGRDIETETVSVVWFNSQKKKQFAQFSAKTLTK